MSEKVFYFLDSCLREYDSQYETASELQWKIKYMFQRAYHCPFVPIMSIHRIHPGQSLQKEFQLTNETKENGPKHVIRIIDHMIWYQLVSSHTFNSCWNWTPW